MNDVSEAPIMYIFFCRMWTKNMAVWYRFFFIFRFGGGNGWNERGRRAKFGMNMEHKHTRTYTPTVRNFEVMSGKSDATQLVEHSIINT